MADGPESRPAPRTGPEHYREAQRLLLLAADAVEGGMPVADCEAWEDAASEMVPEVAAAP